MRSLKKGIYISNKVLNIFKTNNTSIIIKDKANFINTLFLYYSIYIYNGKKFFYIKLNKIYKELYFKLKINSFILYKNYKKTYKHKLK